MAIPNYTNYTGCVNVGTTLYVGDTITSPDGSYVLTITATGISITFDGSITQWPISGLVGVTKIRFTPVSIVIYIAGGTDIITLSIVAVRICLEDNGQLVAFDVAGDIEPILSFSNAFVLVSAPALAALEALFSDVEAKFRVLKQTVRRVSFGVQEETEVPKQSGFPGTNDSDEKVA